MISLPLLFYSWASTILRCSFSIFGCFHFSHFPSLSYIKRLLLLLLLADTLRSFAGNVERVRERDESNILSPPEMMMMKPKNYLFPTINGLSLILAFCSIVLPFMNYSTPAFIPQPFAVCFLASTKSSLCHVLIERFTHELKSIKERICWWFSDYPCEKAKKGNLHVNWALLQGRPYRSFADGACYQVFPSIISNNLQKATFQRNNNNDNGSVCSR